MNGNTPWGAVKNAATNALSIAQWVLDDPHLRGMISQCFKELAQLPGRRGQAAAAAGRIIDAY